MISYDSEGIPSVIGEEGPQTKLHLFTTLSPVTAIDGTKVLTVLLAYHRIVFSPFTVSTIVQLT